MACLSVDSSNTDDPDFIDQRGWLFPTDLVISSQLRNLLEKTLLGRFIDDRYFSEATIQQVVNSFWLTKGPIFMEKRSVLPQLQFLAMDVWVQAHNIPIECYYSDCSNLLGSAAGHLLQVDWSDVRTRSLDFFRFKVRIHTDEPLIPGAFIELLEGDYHWISFRYERIFRDMEMDQNLVFNVDISDNHSFDKVFHTPEGDPSPLPVPNLQPVPPPVQGSSSWWQSAISLFSPPSPSLINPPQPTNVNHTTTPPQPTPNVLDHQLNSGQPSTLHTTSSNPLHSYH
ncbi:hypothetical protein RHMOL_Rhmol04G0188400 [Rhododendron molle]|uniref:Uncharacterized protein n=1 Tax=Rhododendron molle TaxID=49168 RepID=A0ACC0P253_RHOML|nr:hypothetical protein RHMOL_Rhmol04G0188400 [Rhododendron molle]